jgi:hypothetical protein
VAGGRWAARRQQRAGWEGGLIVWQVAVAAMGDWPHHAKHIAHGHSLKGAISTRGEKRGGGRYLGHGVHDGAEAQQRQVVVAYDRRPRHWGA